MSREYNSGTVADSSTIDTSKDQIQSHYYQKQALIEARKEQYFTQLADVTSMPKHFGKKIKRYHYLPMLDVGNTNDQGIDAAGAVISALNFYVTFPRLVLSATDATAAAVTAAINDDIAAGTMVAVAGAAGSAGAGMTTITLNQLTGIYLVGPKDTILTKNLGASVLQGYGNLYGSSKDIGTIAGKLPALSETGGRVNRVGFKRVELEGTIEKFGFFDEYTQESLDFDTDAELAQHINREMISGANEMTEDALQIDLINAAGVTWYAGDADSNATLGNLDLVTYKNLMDLSIKLDNNRTPKSTKIITGTRMVDTRVLPAARVLFIGSELIPTIKAMKDLHNNPAFISVEKYAAGGTTVTGEIGAIDAWRIVVVPEMMKWAGAGADASGDADSHETNGRYDVFPMLAVGSESFTTIGFQTDGKTVKFKITHKAPGEATADRNDPYGETGFMSIKWYYGFMTLRSERIACLRTVARL